MIHFFRLGIDLYRGDSVSFKQIDYIFPFVIFAYGFIVTVIVNTPLFVELADKRLPQYFKKQIMGHRMIAMVCLVLGSFWTLQHLWYY